MTIIGEPPTPEQQESARIFATKILVAAQRFQQQTGKSPMIEIHPDDIDQYLKALSGYHPADSNDPKDWIYPNLGNIDGSHVFGHSVVARDSGARGVVRFSIPIVIDD